MNSLFIPSLLFYYGSFLILCGIASVALIGMKAKTALVSGGLSGAIAITIGHFISQGSSVAQIAGIVICLMLFVVFCWRSAKTLFAVFQLVPERHPDLNGKGIAFLIISLMAVVTLFVLLLQLSLLSASNLSSFCFFIIRSKFRRGGPMTQSSDRGGYPSYLIAFIGFAIAAFIVS